MKYVQIRRTSILYLFQKGNFNMKYLIRANKVVFSGNMKMIIKYVSDFYNFEVKEWTGNSGEWNDLGQFKSFIESKGYSIKDKIPSNCRCEGTAITNAEFKEIWSECHFDIKTVAQRLHIEERIVAQIARKMKVRK